MDCGIHGVHHMVNTNVHSGLGHYGRQGVSLYSALYHLLLLAVKHGTDQQFNLLRPYLGQW